MTVCLGEELLPFVPSASQVLLKSSSVHSLSEYIPLINQIIAKFKVFAFFFIFYFIFFDICAKSVLIFPVSTETSCALLDPGFRPYYLGYF